MTENRELFLKTNLTALAGTNRELYLRLTGFAANTDVSGFYSFAESRGGEIVPSLNGQALHSLIDPKREAQRLISAIGENSGFLICLGFGGGFLCEAALEQTDAHVTAIDFGLKGIIELFSSRDYTHLIKNDRFSFLADPSGEEIKSFLTEHYKPALYGGIQSIPLRARVEADKPLFSGAIAAIQEAIEIVSGDYTVQTHFGKRWFSNIIRNIKQLTINSGRLLFKESIKEAAIAAAGPSLDTQIQLLAELKARNAFIISTDTALPVLAHNGIIPDAVVSIDCQHISYYHFKNASVHGGVPLIMDIASPPILSRLPGLTPVFFAGGHPLARYISASCGEVSRASALPPLDTSGANVTYACLSAAEYLGAGRVHLFGADFSYINSRSYARGTYIYPYFQNRQNRFSPAEAQFSRFLYRSRFLPAENTEQLTVNNEKFADNGDRKYFETPSLRFYRKKLEEKASVMNAEIVCAAGFGAPVTINKKQLTDNKEQRTVNNEKDTGNYYLGFLEKYRDDIAALPEAESKENYFTKLDAKNRQIFTTLLPYMAAVKKRKPEITLKELIKEVKNCCIAEIERVLS